MLNSAESASKYHQNVMWLGVGLNVGDNSPKSPGDTTSSILDTIYGLPHLDHLEQSGKPRVPIA